jgi:hypothetical protein
MPRTKESKKVEVKYVTDDELDLLDHIIFERFQRERKRGYSGTKL